MPAAGELSASATNDDVFANAGGTPAGARFARPRNCLARHFDPARALVSGMHSRAKRAGRIDAGGARRGYQAREHRNDNEEDGHYDEGRRVGGAHLEEQGLQQPGACVGSGDAEDQADEGDAQSLTDVAAGATNSNAADRR